MQWKATWLGQQCCARIWDRLDEGDPICESTNLKAMAIREAELV